MVGRWWGGLLGLCALVSSCGTAPNDRARGFTFPSDGRVVELTREDGTTRVRVGVEDVAGLDSGRLIAPLAILDVRDVLTQRSDYEVTLEDVVRWEGTHGELPADCVLAVRTGWGRRRVVAPDEGADADGVPAAPGVSEAAVQFLVNQRSVRALAVETDALQGTASTGDPEGAWLSRGRYVVLRVGDLSSLPAVGALAVVAPSRSTERETAVRMLAVAPGDGRR